MIKIEDNTHTQDHVNLEDMNLFAQNPPAYDDISLFDKSVEPDTRLSGKLAVRNWQMGNITKQGYILASHNINTAMKMFDIPFNYGGFLASSIGLNMLKREDINILLSNSVEGFLRDNLVTRKHQISKSFSKNKVGKVLDQGIK